MKENIMAITFDTRNKPVDPSLFSVVVATGVAFAIAIALLPGPEEQAEVYKELGRYHDAIAVLENAQTRNGLTPFEAYSLAQLYEQVGRSDDLKALIQSEIARNSSASWAQAKLAILVTANPSDQASGSADLTTTSLQVPFGSASPN